MPKTPQKHITWAAPRWPAATSKLHSAILPQRHQISNGGYARSPTIRTATLNSDYFTATCIGKTTRFERVVELSNSTRKAKTPFMALDKAACLALIHTLTGEQDQAITLIERFLSTPGPVSWSDFPAEHHTLRPASALGMGFAAQRSALPENPRRTGAEDG